jgi:opacity protein-like surface antigen
MKRSNVRKNVKLGFAVAVLLGCGTLPAAASDIGAHLGYAKGADADEGNMLVGAHAELSLLKFLGLQGAADYRLVESTEVDLGGGETGELKVRSIPLTLTARAYIPGTFSPFVALGAGWYHLIYDYSDEIEALGAEDDSETTFGWHVGGGLRYYVAPKMSLYGEGRAVFVDPDREFENTDLENITDFNYDSTFFAAGLSFHF